MSSRRLLVVVLAAVSGASVWLGATASVGFVRGPNELGHYKPFQASDQGEFLKPLNVEIPHISTDKSIKYDYDIVYVRAKRAGDKVHKRYFTDFSQPVTMEPGADLMLLHPDGKEELLVAGGEGSITDPVVSFDGKWVYYSHIYNLKNHNQWNPPREGADIFKIHVPTRKIVRLTNQRFSPNTGATKWAPGYRASKEKGIAPSKSSGRGKRCPKQLESFSETLRVAKPAQESLTSTWKRALRLLGQLRGRSVGSEPKSRAIELRKSQCRSLRVSLSGGRTAAPSR